MPNPSRLNNQRVLLTYEKDLDLSAFKKWAKKEFPKYKNLSVLGYLNVCAIDFDRAMQTSSQARFDYEGMRPKIELIRSKREWDSLAEKMSQEAQQAKLVELKEEKSCFFVPVSEYADMDKEQKSSLEKRYFQSKEACKALGAEISLQDGNLLIYIAKMDKGLIEFIDYIIFESDLKKKKC